MTTQEFVTTYIDVATAACAGSGIFPETAIAEAIVESEHGESFLTEEANNFFGIKSTLSWEKDGGKFVIKPTREVIMGKPVVIPAKFRKYDTPADSFKNYVHFVTQPGYVAKGVLEAKTPQEQIKCIAAEGYASSPEYAKLIIEVMGDVELFLPPCDSPRP